MLGTAFREANVNAYTAGWDIFRETSADTSLRYGHALITLREKSQQLVRDNPIVAGFQQTLINIVSAKGPTLYVESDNSIQEKQANNVLTDWYDSCDMTSTKSIYNIIEEVIAASFTDGDILINLPINDQRDGVQTVVELIEAYRISTPSDLIKDVNIRHGVQYDNYGRIQGYWVKNYDKLYIYSPTNSSNYQFFPMFRNGKMVTYLFKAISAARCSSSRQYPLITPSISKLKQMDDYHEALIIGARVAACFSAFIVSKNPLGTMKTMTTDISGNPQQQADGKRYTKLQPGMIGYLQPGEEAQFAAPNRPGDNVDAFIVRNCKLLSMTLRIPYIVAFLDTAEVNYSSWRGALLDTNKMIGRWRREIDKMVSWVTKRTLLEANVNGLIRGDITGIRLKSRWPAAGILDSEKEARGNKTDLESKIISRQLVCDEQGNDIDEIEKEVLEEALVDVQHQAEVLKSKKDYEQKYGIVFPIDNPNQKPTLAQDPAASETARKNAGNW